MKTTQFPLLIFLFVLFISTLSCESPASQAYNLLNKQALSSLKGGEARLYQNKAGDTWLSWLDEEDTTTVVLKFTRWSGTNWDTPREINRGSDWFVNWADFPGVASFGNSNDKLMAYWLQESGEGTYDYDIKFSISNDNGQQWSEPRTLHQDGIPAEHGFVSVAPTDNYIQAVWLDGRYTKSEGPMSLRTARVFPDGTISDTLELDNRVCDCCQTAITPTLEGFVAAYRDRTDKEIRDISLVHYNGQSWSAPYQVHPDNWNIAGCPVNGPVLASRGDTVVLAWFTGAVEGGASYLSFSVDGGKTFGSKYQLNEGPNVGRLELILQENGNALVFWVTPQENSSDLKMRSVSIDGQMGEIQYVHELSGGRNSGFPQAALIDKGLLVNFTLTSTDDDRRMTSILFKKDGGVRLRYDIFRNPNHQKFFDRQYFIS